MDLQCFNLIFSLRDVKPCELILTDDDNFIINQFYKIVRKYVYKRGFIKACKTYQLETSEVDMYVCCDVISSEILKRYGKKVI